MNRSRQKERGRFARRDYKSSAPRGQARRIASIARKKCPAATSTALGVNTLSFTASDPDSSNLSQTATATLTVLDHAAAAFASGSGTLNLDFGTLQAGSGTQSRQFRIENLPAAYRAGLDLDFVTKSGDPSGVFSTDALSFTDLAPDTLSNSFDLFLDDTSQDGQFSGQYLFTLSDEKDLSGHAGQQTLVLNVTATVVPESSAVALLGAGVASLLGLARLSLSLRERNTYSSRYARGCARLNQLQCRQREFPVSTEARYGKAGQNP